MFSMRVEGKYPGRATRARHEVVSRTEDWPDAMSEKDETGVDGRNASRRDHKKT
jgi:hypothetical protein